MRIIEEFMECMGHYVDLSKFYKEPIIGVEVNGYTYSRMVYHKYVTEKKKIYGISILINNELPNYQCSLKYDCDKVKDKLNKN